MRSKTMSRLLTVWSFIVLYTSYNLQGCRKKDDFEWLPDCDTLNCKCEAHMDPYTCGQPRWAQSRWGPNATPPTQLRQWCAFNQYVQNCTFTCAFADTKEMCLRYQNPPHNCDWRGETWKGHVWAPYCGTMLEKLPGAADGGGKFANSSMNASLNFSSFNTAFEVINRVLNARTWNRDTNITNVNTHTPLIRALIPFFNLPKELKLPKNFKFSIPVPILGSITLDQLRLKDYETIDFVRLEGDPDRPDVLKIGFNMSQVGFHARVRAGKVTLLKTTIYIKNFAMMYDPKGRSKPLGMKMPISLNALERLQVGQIFSAGCVSKLFLEPPSIVDFKYKATGLRLTGLGILNGFASAIADSMRTLGNTLKLPKRINPAIALQFTEAAKEECPIYDLHGPFVPYIGWNSPFFRLFYYIVNDVLSTDHRYSLSGFTINDLIMAITDSADGSLVLKDLFSSGNITLSNGYTLSVDIPEFALAGLNTFQVFNITPNIGRGAGLLDTRAQQRGLRSRYDQWKSGEIWDDKVSGSGFVQLEKSSRRRRRSDDSSRRRRSAEVGDNSTYNTDIATGYRPGINQACANPPCVGRQDPGDNIISAITNFLGQLFVGGENSTSVFWQFQLEQLRFLVQANLHVTSPNNSIYMDDHLTLGINIFTPGEKNNLDALVSAEPFAGMQFGEISALPYCTATVVRNASLSNMFFSTRGMNLTLKCGDPDGEHCTTGEFRKLADTWRTPAAIQQMNVFVADVFATLNKMVPDTPYGTPLAAGLSNGISVGLTLADQMCNGSYVPPPEPSHFTGIYPVLQWTFFWLFVGLCSAGIIVSIVMWLFMKDDDLRHYTPITEAHEAKALRWHPAAPMGLRLGLPIFAFGSMFLFAASNMSSGATIDLYIALAGLQKVHLPPVKDYSLLSAVQEMWNADAYPIAIFIAAFSGVWAYVKLTLLILCWMVPPKYISARARGRTLEALDLLGKWCLIDLFFNCLNAGAFNMHIDSSITWPDIKILPKQFLILDVVLTPQFGIITFIFAAVLSIICGHIMLHYHRRASALDALTDDERSAAVASIRVNRMETTLDKVFEGVRQGVKDKLKGKWGVILSQSEALCRHKFRSNSAKGYIQFTWFGVSVIFLVLSLVGVALMVGVFEKIIAFDITGLAEWFLGDLAHPSFSIWEMGVNIIPSHTPAGPLFWITVIAYMIFAIFAPMAQCLLLLIVWCVPMTLHMQRALHVTTEQWTSYSALDVLMVALVAAIFQLGKIAALVVGEKCDYIESLLKTFLSEAFKDEVQDFQCMILSSRLLPQSALLFAVVILLNINTQIILRTNVISMQDRAEKQAFLRRELQVAARQSILDDRRGHYPGSPGHLGVVGQGPHSAGPHGRFGGLALNRRGSDGSSSASVPGSPRPGETPKERKRRMSNTPRAKDEPFEFAMLGAKRVRIAKEESKTPKSSKDASRTVSPEDSGRRGSLTDAMKSKSHMMIMSVSRLRHLGSNRLGTWGRVTSHFLRKFAQSLGMLTFTPLADNMHLHTLEGFHPHMHPIEEDDLSPVTEAEIQSLEYQERLCDKVERTLSSENLVCLGGPEPNLQDAQDDIFDRVLDGEA